MALTCQRCSKPVPGDAHFCPSCGAPIVAEPPVREADTGFRRYETELPPPSRRPVGVWILGIYLSAFVPLKTVLLLITSVGQTYLLTSEKTLSPDLIATIVAMTKIAGALAAALAVLAFLAGTRLLQRQATAKPFCFWYLGAAPFANLASLSLLAANYSARESDFVERSAIAGVAWFLMSGAVSLCALAYLRFAKGARAYLAPVFPAARD